MILQNPKNGSTFLKNEDTSKKEGDLKIGGQHLLRLYKSFVIGVTFY